LSSSSSSSHTRVASGPAGAACTSSISTAGAAPRYRHGGGRFALALRLRGSVGSCRDRAVAWQPRAGPLPTRSATGSMHPARTAVRRPQFVALLMPTTLGSAVAPARSACRSERLKSRSRSMARAVSPARRAARGSAMEGGDGAGATTARPAYLIGRGRISLLSEVGWCEASARAQARTNTWITSLRSPACAVNRSCRTDRGDRRRHASSVHPP
jgi:hypothetical protein